MLVFFSLYDSWQSTKFNVGVVESFLIRAGFDSLQQLRYSFLEVFEKNNIK